MFSFWSRRHDGTFVKEDMLLSCPLENCVDLSHEDDADGIRKYSALRRIESDQESDAVTRLACEVYDHMHRRQRIVSTETGDKPGADNPESMFRTSQVASIFLKY